MIYRPQFRYPTPLGMVDVAHAYYMNLFPAGVPANSTIDFVPFQLDDDADFFCRAICGDFNNGATNGFVNFKDPYGRLLFSDMLLIETALGGCAGGAYVLNEEVFCPAGSTWQTKVQNPTNGLISITPILRGVKRCRRCQTG